MSSIDFKLHTNVGQPSLFILSFKLISDMLIWWFSESFQKHLWSVFKMAAKYMSCLTEQKCTWYLTFELFYFIALRVCPREDQVDVTHAISPISLKLSQKIKVIKLFKNPKWFGLPVNPWGISAFTSNPRDKTPKLAVKFYFQQRFLTLTEFSEFWSSFIQQFFKP